MLNKLFSIGIKQYIILLLLFVMMPFKALSQTIDVSLGVASASNTYPQSVFGHAFIRMQYPSDSLDYCFSIESDGVESFANIISNEYKTRMISIPSAEYLSSFEAEGRMVKEYPLNLTFKEGQKLWKLLDERCALQQYPHQDFFHHGCSQELLNLISSCLDGRLIVDEKQSSLNGTTIFTIGTNTLPRSSWIRIYCSLVGSTEATDFYLSPQKRMFAPVLIPTLLEKSKVIQTDCKERQFFKITNDIDLFLPAESSRLPEEGTPVYLWMCIPLLLVIIYGWLVLKRRSFTIYESFVEWLVVVIYHSVLFLMIITQLTSNLSTITGWSWQYLIYNPVPLLGWMLIKDKVNRKNIQLFYFCFAIWLSITLITFLLIGGLLIETQVIMILTYLLFLFTKSLNTIKN